MMMTCKENQDKDGNGRMGNIKWWTQKAFSFSYASLVGLEKVK